MQPLCAEAVVGPVVDFCHILDGIPLWKEQLIRYETDLLLDSGILKGRLSVEQNLSVVLLQDPGHMPDDGRFACAVSPDKAIDGPFVDC